MTARIRATSLILIVLLAVVPQSGDVIGTGIVFDRHMEDLRDAAVVGRRFMKASSLINLANELKKSSSTKPHLLIISAFGNSEDASQTLAGKGATEITYAGVVERLQAAQARGEFKMMRYLAIGNNAMVQTVSGTKVSRSVVSGNDPTVVSAGGRAGEILHIFFNKLPRSIRADGRNPVVLSIYVKTDKLPTAREAEAITRSLQRMLHHEDVRVEMRTDTWFLDDPGVPLWYPFSADQTPPTYADYRARGEMFCFVDEKGIHCRQAQFPN